MDPRLVRLYEDELAHLREVGREFAREHPKARYLGLEETEVADPYVERLLEGFAFLTARVRLKLDAQYPRLVDQILQTLYPNFHAPVPSTMIVRFAVDAADPNLARGFVRGGGVEIEREAFGIAAALAGASVDIDGDERGDGVDGEHAAAGDGRGAGERVFDGGVELGANLRIGRGFGEQESGIAVVLGDAVRVFAVMAGLGEFKHRVFSAGRFAGDRHDNALAFAEVHALLTHAGAAIVTQWQKALLIAQAEIEEGAAAALVEFAHARAIDLAPSCAAPFVAGARDPQRDRLAIAHQGLAGFADGGVEPGFQRLTHVRADSMRFAVS
jgi:hypothetical protein